MAGLLHKLKTFSQGGVHPQEQKISQKIATEKLPLPKMVAIPVSQHIGKPAVPVVERGDMVKVGQVIAKTEGYVSANIHSSVSGKVGKIDMVTDSSGYKRLAINIRVKGDDWLETIDQTPDLIKECNLNPDEIITKILEAGIVGQGGAAFPAHVKLKVPEGKKVDYLIINGVECEPYLTADHRLMLENPDEILVGASILMKALQVEKAIIGIEANKKDAIVLLQQKATEYTGIKVVALEVKYPQGGEKQLIKALLNREVPPGGLPADVGAVVHNVGTVFSVYQAVQKNKPLIERIVTVTGKSVAAPGNFWVRIGTPVSTLIEAAGGLPEDTGKVISGGPMMGKALNNMDVPIAKATSGILLIPEPETKRGKVYSCIRCGKCVEACPMGLEPFQMMLLSKKGLLDEAERENIMDCIECGSCSFECPSNRPILDYMRLGKNLIRKEKAAKKG
ncbi:electron transport complex subunit RsxC [Chondrinema litorale]|uniref:electron transport complex subunit RsxC n=1 Tax=Chondrinema litorale TaxID=2994555 RepID=UPI002543A299|nr:electron transport complex subunit RsxC [Chondrinema litorale]UZR94101.1 electron transport complex subunit RsxC [Chondrinema litorale]